MLVNLLISRKIYAPECHQDNNAFLQTNTHKCNFCVTWRTSNIYLILYLDESAKTHNSDKEKFHQRWTEQFEA